MKIVFLSNILSPHQLQLCDEWVKLGIDLTFIETLNVDKSLLPTGWKFTGWRSYLVDYTTYASNADEIKERILTADVVILGSAPVHLLHERLEREKLTFIYSERIYKNFRTMLKWPYHLLKFSKIYGKYSNLHLLCASAFSAADYLKAGCFKNKAYKWGYFTKVDEKFSVETPSSVSTSGTLHTLMWCARFLKWKHPELPIQMAVLLKTKGYKFILDMYGSGIEQEKMKKLVRELCISDVVSFKGDTPNDEVLKAMRGHDIFLFTSDKNEGWGAVANEAMSNGCVLVGSSAIGSIPFLVKDGENGCVFQSGNIKSLMDKVEWLLNHNDEREKMSINGYNTMKTLWTPKYAATSFLTLVRFLNKGKETPFTEGPCSKAEILNDNWYKEKNRIQ